MYDEFGADYDRFVNWPGRLAVEMPFLEQQLQGAGAQKVLDTACGTGIHAVALSLRGYQVTGADPSHGMIAASRANAERAQATTEFIEAGFGEHAQATGRAYDAVLCLGNSLPHALTAGELDVALLDFHACLQPEGIVIIQSRNFDAVLASADRWMDPQGNDEDDVERVFVRFYDFEPDGLLTFNVLTLRRPSGGAWSQRVGSTRLWPQRQADIADGLRRAGFSSWRLYGDLRGNLYDRYVSPNVVVVARAS